MLRLFIYFLLFFFFHILTEERQIVMLILCKMKIEPQQQQQEISIHFLLSFLNLLKNFFPRFSYSKCIKTEGRRNWEQYQNLLSSIIYTQLILYKNLQQKLSFGNWRSSPIGISIQVFHFYFSCSFQTISLSWFLSLASVLFSWQRWILRFSF